MAQVRKLRQRTKSLAEVAQLVELGFETRPIRPGARASFTALPASQEVGPVPPGVQDVGNHPRPAAGSSQFNGGGRGGGDRVWQTAREQAMRKGPLALGKPWESEVPEGAWGGRERSGQNPKCPSRCPALISGTGNTVHRMPRA